MPVGFQLYDQEHDAPATRGNVVDLWGVEEDWAFPTERASVRFASPVDLGYRAADGYDGSPRLRRAREAAPA
jgi:hypothetical protein